MNKRNKVLVISDNDKIVERFVYEVIPLIYNEIDIEFACSPSTNITSVDHFIFTKINLKDEATIDRLIETKDLIFSIHCKQLFPTKLVQNIKCINVHPGYNPINRGWYPQVFSILNDLDIGATIHEIDEELDNGNIICRSNVKKYIHDTSETLYNRVVDEEIKLLVENIKSIIDNSYISSKPEEKGNLFLKKDFDELCLIDMNKQGTFIEFYNYLRAMSHSPYLNAYFLDENNDKVFLKIEINKIQKSTNNNT